MSGVFIFIRLAKKAPTTILIIVQGISCIIEGVIFGFLLETFRGLYNWEDYVCLLSVGVIGYGAQWSLTKASQLLPAALASILRSTEILWTYTWQMILFRQYPSYLTVLGVVAILVGVLVVTLDKIKQKEAKQKVEAIMQAERNASIIKKGSINT